MRSLALKPGGAAEKEDGPAQPLPSMNGICSHDPSVVECAPGLIQHSAHVPRGLPHCGLSLTLRQVLPIWGYASLSPVKFKPMKTDIIRQNNCATSSSDCCRSTQVLKQGFAMSQLSLTLQLIKVWRNVSDCLCQLRIFQEKITVVWG